jgi:hypothetical protein
MTERVPFEVYLIGTKKRGSDEVIGVEKCIPHFFLSREDAEEVFDEINRENAETIAILGTNPYKITKAQITIIDEDKD